MRFKRGLLERRRTREDCVAQVQRADIIAAAIAKICMVKIGKAIELCSVEIGFALEYRIRESRDVGKLGFVKICIASE